MLIDHTNYDQYLKQSTQGRSGVPDGNVFFDTATDTIELIGVDELAIFDHTSMGGGATDPNQLTNFDGITLRALYLFENQERSADENLRKHKRGTDGVYKFTGAYNFVNGVKLNNAGTDRLKIRQSGWIEYAANGDGRTEIDRIYHGVNSLIDLQPASAPYYTLVADTLEATLQAATWATFDRAGDVDEAIQVFGSTSFGDTGATDFDYTSMILVLRARTWGYTHDETTSVLSQIPEFSGFKAGYGFGDVEPHEDAYNLADVYGGSQVSPWTGMSLEKLVAPQTETGFLEADGDFTWVLHNTAAGSVAECEAFLEALAMQDGDIDDGAGTYSGHHGRVWIHRNDDGLVETQSIEGEGLFIEGLSTSEKQNIVFADDAGDLKHYPFYPEVKILVGLWAKADANAWYHLFYTDGAGAEDFDTATAVTVNDSSSTPVKGLCSTADAEGYISFPYDYDANTQAGLPAATDKDVVVEVESYGPGSVTPEITFFTLTRSSIVNATCSPTLDLNV